MSEAKDWPADVELPTADAVARAVVAAARVLEEDPTRLRAPRQRWRFAAQAALKIVYPAASLSMLERVTGCASISGGIHLKAAQSTAWWKGEGQRAIEAALAALETL